MQTPISRLGLTENNLLRLHSWLTHARNSRRTAPDGEVAS